MQTQCPHCNTIFSIEEDDLKQAEGQVRCGHCLAVFTADSSFSEPPDKPSSKTSNSKPSATKPPPEPTQIKPQPKPAPKPAPEPTKNSLSAQLEKSESEFVFPQADEIERAEKKAAEVIPPALRMESRKGKGRFGFMGTLLLTLAILTGISTLMLQYTYYNRDTLAKIVALRPMLQFMCRQTGCLVPLLRDRSKIVFKSKNIYSHPKIKDALVVSAIIVNKASFAQDYPIIELRFENVRGEAIAGRRFNAVEYLSIPENQISEMQPNETIAINLSIKDPGSEMVSYEFTFL